MLASAEKLAYVLKLDKGVVFGWLRDLVIEGSERSPFGLVASEQGSEAAPEPATLGSLSLQEILSETARMADARHGQPSVPEWGGAA